MKSRLCGANFLEEIGYAILSFKLVTQATQFQSSGYYKQYFKKIGSFYAVEALPKSGAVTQDDHRLLWLAADTAARSLSLEFQRWAIGEWIAQSKSG